MADSCATCRHGKRHDQMGVFGLYCHGAPPSVQILPAVLTGGPENAMKMMKFWPPMEEEELCGAFQPKGIGYGQGEDAPSPILRLQP